MIEFCTKRRMILSIIGLGILTILILILEETITADLGLNGSGTHLQNGSHFPTSSQRPTHSSVKPAQEVIPAPAPEQVKPAVDKEQQGSSKPCWLTETFEVQKECSPCTEFEISSGSPTACVGTGRKETLKCSKSGIVYRSCSRVLGLEKKQFLAFEGFMLLITVLGIGIVKLRSSQLERQFVRQIERKLASGY